MLEIHVNAYTLKSKNYFSVLREKVCTLDGLLKLGKTQLLFVNFVHLTG